MSTFSLLLLTIISLSFSAFFSGMEIAFISSSKIKIEIDNNPGNFYETEKKHIRDKIIFSLKKTNFIQWINDSKIDPIHIVWNNLNLRIHCLYFLFLLGRKH